MPTLKDAFWAIFFVTLVSAAMMVGVAQLDGSGWAEGIRAEAAAEYEGTENEGGEGETAGDEGLEGLSAPLMFIIATVGSLLKITLLMGIPGLITIGTQRFIDRMRKRTSVGTAPS
ncbi:MAG: hypothetical protein AB8G95_21370 [Anaerolineae bacterium]